MCAYFETTDLWKLGVGGTCDTPCSGDESLVCGGSKTFDVFRLVPAGAKETARAVPVTAAAADDNADAIAIEEASRGDHQSISNGVLTLSYRHRGCFKADEMKDEEGVSAVIYRLGTTPAVSATHGGVFVEADRA